MCSFEVLEKPEYQNQVLYFFSSSAQVWAALVAFGGMAIRDRMLKYEDSMDGCFQQMVLRMQPVSKILSKYSKEEYSDGIFLDQVQMANYIEKIGDFKKIIQQYNPAIGTVFYSSGSLGGTPISLTHLESQLTECRGYFRQYLIDEKARDHLAQKIHSILWGGLGLIITSLVALGLTDWLARRPFAFALSVIVTLLITSLIFYEFAKAFQYKDSIRKRSVQESPT